ncbi:penicillin-binding protein 2 [Methyloceanibacter sp.]|uniref:penicillin-binding protein 2 n=1 Tax=Methyloceanibacter sp. TaxID=1965321 RepID=UPI002D535810|nr:penicillin-binding protein 2 [Methyloceanibacter sp.]HZP07758.1 penicillin-binding protein 2 [Methyloceanibacter sp.]
MKTRAPDDANRRDPARKQRLRFSRRALLLGAGQAGLFGLLGWRLRQLQILDTSEYRLLSDENRLSRQLTAPRRGAIYDRFGTAVAESRESLRVVVVPAFAKGLGRTLDALARFVPITEADRDRVLRTARRQSSYRPVLVAEGLSWRQFALLNVLAPQLPGVATDVGSYRVYNSPEPLAHVVGYVGMAGKGEVDEDPVMRVPGFRRGKTGLEKGFDPWLRGHAGAVTSEVDAHGRIVRELGSTPSAPGRDLVLTIDHELQAIAFARLATERRGSLVALDCHTGDVLAMVSVPSFNPNDIAFRPNSARWAELVRNEDEPLNNRAVDGQYPPGSTFKVVIALAALASGVVKPDEHIVCKGSYFFGNHLFHCWKSHGPIALHDAIKSSCDVYFYETAHRMGIDKLAVTGRALGLGRAYDSELPGAKPGVMPDTAWKRKTLRQPWYPGETISCAIGQGYVLATPLHLALVAGRIASGKAIVPRFVRPAPGLTVDEPKPLAVDPAHLQLVREGMTAVVNEKGGTATRVALKLPGVLMAGKTGTAQAFGHGVAHHFTGYDAKPHSLFIAFAPVDAPRYSMACVVEHGGWGAQTAAPIVHDVMTELLVRDPAARPAFVASNAPEAGSTVADAGTRP